MSLATRPLSCLLAAVLIMLVSAADSPAQIPSQTLNPVQESDVKVDTLERARANESQYYVNAWEQSGIPWERRAYLKFELAPPPPNTLVAQARLLLRRAGLDPSNLPVCSGLRSGGWDVENFLGDVAPDPDTGPSDYLGYDPPTAQDVWDVTSLVNPVGLGSEVIIILHPADLVPDPVSYTFYSTNHEDARFWPLLVIEYEHVSVTGPSVSWGAVKSLYGD